MRRRYFVAPLLLGFGLLAGCGQKGPLFLPKPVVNAPAGSASTAKPAAAITVSMPAAASSGGH